MRTVGFGMLLEALDVSLDRRKIFFAMGGLFVAAGIPLLLVFIAQAADWHLGSIVFLVLAGLAAWILSSLVYGTVAKMSYDGLSQRPGRGWLSALVYATRHLPSLLLSPLALLLAIALVLVAEGLVLSLSRIPYFGELWASLLFLPLVALNLFLILLGYLGMWLTPAVVAGEGGGVLRTLRHIQAAVRRAPGRILAYLSSAVILGMLAALIIVPLVSTATLGTMAFTAVALGPEKMTELAAPLPDHLLAYVPYQIRGFLFEQGYGIGYGSSSVTFKIAGAILLLAFLLIPFAILAMLLIVLPVSCACASYLSVRELEPKPPVPAARLAEPAPGSCPSCGAEVAPQARFCLRCGHPQEPG